jgi:hypothetical protein
MVHVLSDLPGDFKDVPQICASVFSGRCSHGAEKDFDPVDAVFE